jgi:N-acetylated-alpha-linked acidic dipeptidase
LAKDPTLGFAGPTPKQIVPYLDFSSMDNALAFVKTTSEELKSTIEKVGSADVQKIVRLNEILYKSEQKLLNPNGLPRRPWYKHMIYAPGFYTGYGVKTLPGIREGIEESNWKEAQEYINIVASTLLQFNASLKNGIEALK